MLQDSPSPVDIHRHNNQDFHFIGNGLLVPTTVTSVGLAGQTVGLKPAPAREDHKHQIDTASLDTRYSQTSHTHSAGDATTLDGIDSTGFALAGHTHAAPGRSGFALRRATNQSIANSSRVAISWDTEDEDSGGWIAVTSSTITVPSGGAGIMFLSVLVRWAGTGTFGGSSTNELTILFNGLEYHTSAVQNTTAYSDGSNVWSSHSAGPILASVGNTFQVYVEHDSGASRNILAWFRGYKLMD